MPAAMMERDTMPKAKRNIAKDPAGPKSDLAQREQEALRLLRELDRAERHMPKQATRRLRQGNRYIAH
jgi:hypothetical protein